MRISNKVYILIHISVFFFLLIYSPVYGVEAKPAPNFKLTDQTGKAVQLSDFKGKVVVMDWIFTRCSDVCVMQTKRFKKLQDGLKEKGLFGGKVVLVSITMDPKHDTAPVLKSFAEKTGADTSGWYFLTGDLLTIYKVASEYDFYSAKRLPAPGDLAYKAEENKKDEYSFSHQEKTFIIDQNGNLVKVKEGESLEVSSVLKDVVELAKNKPDQS